MGTLGSWMNQEDRRDGWTSQKETSGMGTIPGSQGLTQPDNGLER